MIRAATPATRTVMLGFHDGFDAGAVEDEEVWSPSYPR